MSFLYGRVTAGPLVLLHGGAGAEDPHGDWLTAATKDLITIGNESLNMVDKGKQTPVKAVVQALKGMEANPKFNAGLGSALQSDGQARLTAAIMDGAQQTFSGVISVSHVKHPSILAEYLQQQSSRVLTQPGCEMLARTLQLPIDNVITQKRLDRWYQRAGEQLKSYDTVGCVAWDGKHMAAGTSTGGRGFEYPGRVSDSATVAGSYASAFAAISATGVGEEIVDDALAARIETRVRDGMSLVDACKKAYDEAQSLKRQYGWIACDAAGNWVAAFTTKAMTFAVLGPNNEVLKTS